jgi:hypothetical protein
MDLENAGDNNTEEVGWLKRGVGSLEGDVGTLKSEMICDNCQIVIDSISLKEGNTFKSFKPPFLLAESNIAICQLCSLLKATCLSLGHSLSDKSLETSLSYIGAYSKSGSLGSFIIYLPG